MSFRIRKPVFTEKGGNNRLRYSIIALMVLIVVLAAIVGAHTYTVYREQLPSFERLHNIEPSINTRIYDRNGVLLKEFYSENRVLVPLEEMPEHLRGMLIASEDQKFYDHWGIDVRRLGIVAISNMIAWDIKGGASTITQQLARMLFLTQSQTLERKIKEAMTAVKLERTYSKDEILEMYLNQHYFSRGAYGVAAAARQIFNKSVADLSINDCAILIGMLKGPNINSPLKDPEKARQARNRVLMSYYNWGGLTEAQYDSLRQAPLDVSPPVEDPGIAPYFTETIRREILAKYGEDVLYSGGLKVYTSLDARLQKIAEQAVYKKLDSLQSHIERTYPRFDKNYTMFLPDTVNEHGDSIRVYRKVQGAFVSIDNATGDVLAMIGGRSFDQSEFNRAVQANRQPGSAFKPFIYTAAVDNGINTTDIMDDNPIVLDIPGTEQYRPHNFDNEFLGPLTIRDAIRLSRNLVAVRLILRVSPEEAIYYAHRMGISTPLEPIPSLAVGACEVKVVEMVSAMSTFPNRGIHIPYRYIHRIVDRYGRVLENNTAIQKEEVLSAQTAHIMTSLLQSVMEPGGTAYRARWMGFTRPAGGKTGTTNNFCDNWFVGFTPQITSGVWVGFDTKLSIGGGQDGAHNAVPIWTEYMIQAHDSLPIMDFEEPDGIIHIDVCVESGEIATDRCLEVRSEVFIDGNQPTVTCRLHPSAGLHRGDHQMRFRPKDKDTSDDRVHF
ncbi:MAG: PBP1A family penicillin-binding protein [Candidatus Zixiibacteriota bacterium]